MCVLRQVHELRTFGFELARASSGGFFYLHGQVFRLVSFTKYLGYDVQELT